ncbi:MAG: hypothetical protein WBV92_06075 [Nitrosotalea sp.]
MNTITLESLPFSDIDLNLSWAYDEETSTEENFIYNVLASCDQIPAVFIENPNGRFRLQFRKENSIIKLHGNQLWYNRNNLTSIMKLPTA